MNDIAKLADEADMIINGYAFKKDDVQIRVINLNNPIKAALINLHGEFIETTMDDIELDIVKDYYKRNGKYMED